MSGSQLSNSQLKAAAIDRATLVGVSRREPKALAAFFESTFDRVYGLAARLLNDRQKAEDIAQEVFYRVMRSAERIDPDRDPLPWLRTITANLCRDHWRSFPAKLASRSQPVNGEESRGAGELRHERTPESELIAEERQRLVQAAIAQLPAELREVIVLRDYEGLDHVEIAGMIGVRHAAVRKRYSRALSRLGALLGDELT